MRVGSRLQGGRRAILVALVARDNVGKYQRLVRVLATRTRLQRPAPYSTVATSAR